MTTKRPSTNGRRLPQIAAGHGEKRSRKQTAAIAALLGQPTIEAAAKAAGIGERTLRTWLTQPGFRRQYREARGHLLDAAIGQLQKASGAAVAVLLSIAEDVLTPPAVRVSAARAILTTAIAGAEMIDLDERLTAIEEALARAENGG